MDENSNTGSPDCGTPGSQASPPPTPPPRPVYTPPPVIAPARSVEPRRGSGWKVLAIILLLLLAVSVLYNLANFAGSVIEGGTSVGQTAGPRLIETVRENHDTSDKIAVVDLQGIIMGGSMDPSGFGLVEVVKAQFKRAKQDDRVKAVVLKVDSPGARCWLRTTSIGRSRSFRRIPGSRWLPRWAVWPLLEGIMSRRRAVGSWPMK